MKIVAQRIYWKDIPWYEGYYQISNLWMVKSIERKRVWKFWWIYPEKIIKWYLSSGRYLYIKLHKDNDKILEETMYDKRWLEEAKSRIQALSEEQKIMRVWDDDDYSRKIEWLFVWFTSDWDAVIENEKYWLVRRNNFETVTHNK